MKGLDRLVGFSKENVEGGLNRYFSYSVDDENGRRATFYLESDCDKPNFVKCIDVTLKKIYRLDRKYNRRNPIREYVVMVHSETDAKIVVNRINELKNLYIEHVTGITLAESYYLSERKRSILENKVSVSLYPDTS